MFKLNNTNAKYFLVTCAFCVFFGLQTSAQVVNIESLRIQSDTIRIAGHFNVSYAFQKNDNKTLHVFKSNLVYQFKTKSFKDIFFVLGNYEFTEANASKLSNAGFIHLRYNRKLNKTLRWEIYHQDQTNRLLALYFRSLTGTGMRLKLAGKKYFKSYLGIAAFYEYEESQEAKVVYKNDFRSSNYWVLSFELPGNKGEITSTTYYQPMLNNWSDFRLTNQTQLVLSFNKNWSYTCHLNYFFDKVPPTGIRKEAISFDNGIRVNF